LALSVAGGWVTAQGCVHGVTVRWPKYGLVAQFQWRAR